MLLTPRLEDEHYCASQKRGYAGGNSACAISNSGGLSRRLMTHERMLTTLVLFWAVGKTLVIRLVRVQHLELSTPESTFPQIGPSQSLPEG